MRRCLPLALAVTLLVVPAADAHRLTTNEAKRVTRKYAREDYYPARIHVQFCRRYSEHRVNCRFLAFYDENYCSAWYALRLRGDTIYVSRPLLESC
jgi:hypothetical protein